MIKTKYLRIRKKKYYFWIPDDSAISAGFPSTVSLGKDYVEAVKKAEEWNKSLGEYRKTGDIFYPGDDKNSVPNSKIEGTVAYCIIGYRKSRMYLDLKTITQKGYDYQLNFIERDYGEKLINGLQRKHANTIYEKRLKEGTIRSAQDYIKVFKIIVEYARVSGLFLHPKLDIEMDNPFKGLKIKYNESRQEVWNKNEIGKLFKATEELEYTGIKTAIILAYWTALRQTDIINLQWKDYDGSYIKVLQSKTESTTRLKIKIPVYKLNPLKDHLDNLKRKCDHIVCYFDKNKKEIRNYKRDLFVHHFIKVKKKIGINKLFRDFRRTAITKLAESGCSVPEIASFSGHSHKSALLIKYI